MDRLPIKETKAELSRFGSPNPYPSLVGIPCWRCRQQEADCSWTLSLFGGNKFPLCAPCEIGLQSVIADYFGFPEEVQEKALRFYIERWERELQSNGDS